MSKRLLMVAFHFPPLAGSSGIQRSLSFAQQLPAHGWQPTVLTAHPRAYESSSPDLLDELPADLDIVRAFALDASRHLALFKRYPGCLARPDRWLSWLLGALPAGLRLIRQQRPAAIWSTYPIPTAHLIGGLLARLSGLPWIADFRDPMAHDGYPQDPATWQSYLRTERRVFGRANRLVFTTPGAARLYRARYPERADDVHVIENGYDEASFARAESQPLPGPLNPGKITLLHSGIVYPDWRNPSALFAALRDLFDSGALRRERLRLRFRAPVHEAWLGELAAAHGLGDVVEILPPLGYLEALREMLASDGLLVLQADDCNDQVPAKTYEYLRCGRPILGLAHPLSDTAALLEPAAMGPICALEDRAAIAAALPALLRRIDAAGSAARPSAAIVRAASRQERAADLAALLDQLLASDAARSPLSHRSDKPIKS